MASISEQDDPQLEWMWEDARVLPLPGMGLLAKINPLRWSSGPVAKILDELAAAGEEARPVRLRVSGQSYHKRFPSPSDAARWITSTCDADAHPTERSAVQTLAVKTASLAAVPHLAVFCRVNSVPCPLRRTACTRAVFNTDTHQSHTHAPALGQEHLRGGAYPPSFTYRAPTYPPTPSYAFTRP